MKKKLTNASFLFMYLYFSNCSFSQTLFHLKSLPFHHCDSLMFYLSLMPGSQSSAPTSSISSFQSSFFSISRPLTDQHEKHWRVYFHNTPFSITRINVFVVLETNTPKYKHSYYQCLSDPSVCKQRPLSDQKRSRQGSSCTVGAAYSRRYKQKQKQKKLNKHLIWFTTKIIFLLN